MIPYFENEAAWARTRAELLSWKGTPYKHITRVKGRGADCTLFVGDVWETVGILRELSYHYYPKEWYKNAKDERILENLYRHFQDHAAPGITIERLAPKLDRPLLRGDMLTFSIFSKVSNHAGVYLGDEEIIHASPKKGVVAVPLSHFLRPKLTNIFRIMRSE